MKKNPVTYLIWVILAASLLATFAIYSRLPDQIPLHWNFKGEVDRIGAKSGVFITALMPLGIYLLMFLLPKIDPKKENYRKHAGAYGIITVSIVLMMVAIHWITIAASLGLIVNVALFIKIGIGILFVILGNVMPKLKFNYFVGIRSPWTLANEEVWRRTHRVGGITFVAVGALMIVLSFFEGLASSIIYLASAIGMVFFLMIYSYLLFRKIEK